MKTYYVEQFIQRLGEKSEVIREPAGEGPGYWVGAPGLYFDDMERAWYLTYRIRRPRGVDPDRGGETRIARSGDGRTFEDVFSLRKEALATPSIERAALFRGNDGRWHWMVSYVDPSDNRWCIARAAAGTVNGLRADRVEVLFRARSLGLEGIKDPFVWRERDRYCLLASVALSTESTSEAAHATADIYNTGECASATGLAVSDDGENWTWKGVVFRPESAGWDGYCRRINTVVRDGDGYLGFYDGIPDHTANYEEKTGWARSADLRTWKSLTPQGPGLASPHASGSLRYLTLCADGDRTVACFEVARPDGAHELRLANLDDR